MKKYQYIFIFNDPEYNNHHYYKVAFIRFKKEYKYFDVVRGRYSRLAPYLLITNKKQLFKEMASIDYKLLKKEVLKNETSAEK